MRQGGRAPVAGGTAGRNEVGHPGGGEGLPQAASGLAGSAARTRLIGRGTSNAAARSAASIVTPAIVTPWPRPVRGSAETGALAAVGVERGRRSEEHTSELQSLMRTSYAVFCLKKKNNIARATYSTLVT